MMTLTKSTRWILLGVAIVVLIGMGTTGWILYANYRAWHSTQSAPLFAEIEPSDVAVIHGKDAWIRWNSGSVVVGRVLWREAGGLRVQVADAGKGPELLAHLGPLRFGKKYEYTAEQRMDGLTQRSRVRSFVVRPGLAFDQPADQTVEHDYDQSVKLTLRNTSAEPITVTAKALKQFDDLPADVTGYGSVDVPAKIAPNSTLELRLAVTAADAANDTYEIPIEAAGAYVTARFRVKFPKLNLAFRVVDDDPKTLAKTVEIKNNGDTLTDLAIRSASANQQDLELQPSAEHARLDSGGTLRLTVSPILYLEFESLKAQIDVSAARQTTHFPMEFKPPSGTHLIAFRSASTTSSTGSDWYCTNKPNTCSILPGPHGSGPVTQPPPKSEGPPIAENRSLDYRQTAMSVATNPSSSISAPHDFQAPPGWLRTSFLSASNFFSDVLAAEEPPSRGPAGCKPPCKQLDPKDPTTFKLPAGNEMFSPYGNWRVYPKSPSPPRPPGCKDTHSVNITNYIFDPNCDAAPTPDQPNPRPHPGNDYTSDNADGTQTPLPFSSPISGIVKYDRRSNYNIVRISACCPTDPPSVCEKGYTIEFLHTSSAYVSNGQRVSPGTVLGATGGAGAGGKRFEDSEFHQSLPPYWDGGKTHLHVQVRDPKGTLVDPNAEGPLVNPPACDCVPVKGPPRDNRGPYVGKGPLQTEGKDYGKRVELGYRRRVEWWLEECSFEEEMAPPGYGAQTLADCLQGSQYKAEDAALKSAEKLANDPPDATYQRLAVAPSDSVVGYMEAITTSMERYQGAKDAGDRNWTAQHFTSMQLYFGRLAGALRRDADALQTRGERLPAENTTTQARLEQAWRQVLDKLRQKGLTPKDLQAMRAADIPEGDVRAVMYRILAYPQRSMVGEPQEVQGFTDVNPLAVRSLRTMLLESAEENRRWAAEAERIGTLPPSSEFRTGLPAALERRASFTRAHRGPFAGELEDGTVDSSDFAIGWHTAAHVYFAWHQDNDQVIFAAFDTTGKMVLEPQMIGKGHWPRLAADGNRVAIAWSSPDRGSFTVRLNDGKQWGNEVQLFGSEAAVAFATGGPLYAATSTGLWKLNGDHFDRVQEANYSQPAVTVDKEGKPHVAWQHNGRVVFDGSDVGEGERPSAVITSDGGVNLAYLSHGALLVRSGKRGQWSEADSIPAKNPSWPTLALDNAGGVRLSYIGAAEFGPNALWLVRLPDKNPILMPSLAGNVTDSWFAVKFGLREVRNNYRRHDVLLTVNDVWVKMFENTVPEGRYMYRLNPFQIFTSPGQPVPNRVAIHSWHMNPGHYASNSDYQLIVRTSWGEHYVFATNENDARLSTTSERVNHNQPDLGIYANAANLPVEQPKPGRLDVPLLIANLGEATSAPTQLLMLGEKGAVLATAAVPPLKPGADQTIKMPFDYDGKLRQLVFRFDNNVDFDPSNDSLSLTLWAPPPTGYAGPQPTDKVPEAGMPKVPIELTVKLFNDNTLPSSYRIVDASNGRMISKVVNGEQFAGLPAGTYEVAVKPFPYEGQEILYTDKIQHQAGVSQTVELNSGIRLDTQSAGNVFQWSAVDSTNPARTIQWQSGGHSLMALPPGEYQVAMQPIQFYSQPVVWPQKIQVQAGQIATFKLDSGVRLDMAQDMGPLWQWWLVSPGKPDQAVQRQNGDQRKMVVPPGEYHVAIQPVQYYSQPAVWPQKIQVQAGQTATFTVSSGVRMIGPLGASPDFEFQFLNDQKHIAQVGQKTWNTQVLPPGMYSLQIRRQYGQWKTVADQVQVKEGQMTEVKISELPRQ